MRKSLGVARLPAIAGDERRRLHAALSVIVSDDIVVDLARDDSFLFISLSSLAEGAFFFSSSLPHYAYAISCKIAFYLVALVSGYFWYAHNGKERKRRR